MRLRSRACHGRRRVSTQCHCVRLQVGLQARGRSDVDGGCRRMTRQSSATGADEARDLARTLASTLDASSWRCQDPSAGGDRQDIGLVVERSAPCCPSGSGRGMVSATLGASQQNSDTRRGREGVRRLWTTILHMRTAAYPSSAHTSDRGLRLLSVWQRAQGWRQAGQPKRGSK